LLLAAPQVLSINRFSPPSQGTSDGSVVYRVQFSKPVAGGGADDFRVSTTGNLQVNSPLTVTSTGYARLVIISGISGQGELRLDLIDDDSIVDGEGAPLGGAGIWNGSFQGQTYTVDQVAPTVLAINRTNSNPSPPGAATANYSVTFSEPVTGVDAADFALATTGSVAANPTVVVSGGPAAYSVTVNGLLGTGTLGLNLVDNSTILDLHGNRLTAPVAAASFAPQVTSPAGLVPLAVAAGDLNADGYVDAAVANFLAGNVSLMWGNGSGTFATQTTLTTGAQPHSVVIADLNGDHWPDIVTANYLSGTVSVLLGAGGGAFLPQVAYAAGINPAEVVVSDLNRDGRPDLAVANRGSNSLSVLLGNGNGTFQPQVAYPVGVRPQGLVAADLNLDSTPDLVVANSGSDAISILLGIGNGTLQAQTTVGTGINPQSVVAGDFDNNGTPDIAVANFGANSVSVLLGPGNGNLIPSLSFATGSQPQDVIAADVNADGRLDLIVANSGGNNLGVLLGDGTGGFGPQSTFAAGSSVGAVVAQDVNLDKRYDLLAVNLFGNSLSVLTGVAAGGFVGQAYTLPTANILARQLFYSQSAFDVTNESLPGFSNDNAIAPDKTAYLPGAGVASFDNVTSYSRGINGIMIDLAGSHPAITAADFVFKTGNSNDPTSWATAAAPALVTVRPGAGLSGADRIELIWSTGAAVRNAWLEVQVLANANTLLAAPDAFFFGSRTGDTGAGAPPNLFLTSAADVTAARSNASPQAPITNLFDFNRDGLVTAADQTIILNNQGTTVRLNLDSAGPFSPVAGTLQAVASALAAQPLFPAEETSGLLNLSRRHAAGWQFDSRRGEPTAGFNAPHEVIAPALEEKARVDDYWTARQIPHNFHSSPGALGDELVELLARARHVQ
jgi:hypothetical protein